MIGVTELRQMIAEDGMRFEGGTFDADEQAQALGLDLQEISDEMYDEPAQDIIAALGEGAHIPEGALQALREVLTAYLEYSFALGYRLAVRHGAAPVE